MLATRDQIATLLERWRLGQIDALEVEGQAEIWLEGARFDHENSDPDSILVEVLCHLEILVAQKITVGDVPTILDFLFAVPGGERDVWKAWKAYWTKNEGSPISN